MTPIKTSDLITISGTTHAPMVTVELMIAQHVGQAGKGSNIVGAKMRHAADAIQTTNNQLKL